MAGDIGNSGELTLATNALTNITSINVSTSMADVISQAMGQAHDKHLAGTQDSSITANFEVLKADTTVLGNYAEGTTGAVECHLFGDTATYVEITSTNGTVTNLDLSSSVNGIVAGTVTIVLDDWTLGAAV